MRITGIDTWVVEVPLTDPFASSFETKTGTVRTVLRLRTDTGLTGWGETMHGHPVADLIESMRPHLIGASPFALEAFHKATHMVPFFHGYLGYAAKAGVDIACWDLIGKAANRPVHDLLGGALTDTVPFTALLTRTDVPAGPPADLPAALAAHAADLVSQHGFTALKLKGSTDIPGDLAILRALRNALPDIRLRVDPNASWPVPDTLRAARALEDLDLEYLEDPCAGIEGMAAVRARLRIPLCTNMCLVRFEDFAPAVRAGAVDIVHGDVFKWGGIAATKALAAHCDTFALGMNLHSGGELGVSTAAHLAVAATTPALGHHAIDSMYYRHADDILTTRLTITGARLTVPTAPGLGVTVDENQLDRYALPR